MIVIASDKFKGTLTAEEACRAIADGLALAGVAREELRLMPMADGGDGTAAILGSLTGNSVSVIESHQIIGPQCFGSMPAMERSSYPLGEAVGRCGDKDRVIMAVGGTATCDGGAGMLQALGMRAYGADGQLIERPLTPRLLAEVVEVDFSQMMLTDGLLALSDVKASLVPDGQEELSALDFARQKGFGEEDIQELERNLMHWRQVVETAGFGRTSIIDGAGGGIGYALGAVLGARIEPGAKFVADAYGRNYLDGARLVISGEGCIDAQTGAGKVVAEMACRARERDIAFIAIGGRVKGAHPFPTLAVDGPDTLCPLTTHEAYERLKSAALRVKLRG